MALIEVAVSRGVPLYNRGDARGCSGVYEQCCRDLASLPGVCASVSVCVCDVASV